MSKQANVKVVYKWVNGTRPYCDAQTAGETFERIQEEEGALTPETVLKHAKKKTSPLHDAFEWDDSIAAHKWRKQHAGHLLQNIRVEIAKNAKQTSLGRVYINVSDGTGEYYPAAEVMNDDNLRALAIRKATRKLENMESEYHEYEVIVKNLKRARLNLKQA